MKSSLKVAFCLVLLTVMANCMFGAHILGGHMSYEVISSNGGWHQIRIDVEMYREIGSGAGFDQSIKLGFYTKASPTEYQYYGELGVDLNEVITVDVDADSDCSSSVNTNERGFYSKLTEIPGGVEEFMITYQRCCRTSSTINIMSPQETGIPIHMIVTRAGLESMNKSHKRINPMDRYLVIESSNKMNLLLDESTDQYVIEFIVPFTTGGDDGSSGNSGDQWSCTGVTPDSQSCPPPFDKVILNPSISETSLFYDIDPFEKLSELEYEITPTFSGAYIVSYYVHEYRDSVLLSSHYTEQVYVVTNCELTLDNEEEELSPAVSLYPNPVIDIIYIDNNFRGVYESATILDVNGNEIISINNRLIDSIVVSNLPSGLYFLKLNSGTKIELLKFIKS